MANETNTLVTSEVTYDSAQPPAAEELLDFYRRQNHATTQSREKIERMIEATLCFVTARVDRDLIGFARGTTDGVRGHLVECKLDPRFQGPACITHTDGRIEHDTSGIARQMALRVIDSFRQHGVERVDVLAYETEEDFCRELGFVRARGVVPLYLKVADSAAPSADGQ